MTASWQPSEGDVYFQDWDSLIVGTARLREEGWTVTGAEDLERGVRAFKAELGSEVRHLVWLPWGRVLTPTVRVLSTWQEFVSELELRAREDMEKSDSLEEMQVGFVTFGRAASSGVSEVFRVSVEELARGGMEARQRLIAVVMASKPPAGPSKGSGGP